MAPDDLMAVLRPRRSLADVMAGVIRLELGGQPYELPVRSIADNEAWQTSLAATTLGVLASIESVNDPAKIASLLASIDLLEVLKSYDANNVLPDRAGLAKITRPHEALRAVAEVWQAANPLVDLAAVVLQMTGRPTTSPEPTNSPPPNGAGHPEPSAETSPTSSSSGSSMPPTNGSPTPSNRASRRHASGPSPRTTARRTTHGGGPSPAAMTDRSGSPALLSSKR